MHKQFCSFFPLSVKNFVKLSQVFWEMELFRTDRAQSERMIWTEIFFQHKIFETNKKSIRFFSSL